MSALDNLFDRYQLMARQRPAFLMLFPLIVAAVVQFPALQSWWATLLTVGGGCGVALALAEFAQAAGAKLQPALWASWGGSPSEAMLRLGDQRVDMATKGRYRAFLERRVPDLRFPAAADEAATPTLADVACASASRWLRAQTRDKKKFELLLQQNISYGFRRNCLGLRLYGVSSSIAAVVALGIGRHWWPDVANPSAAIVAGLVAIAMLYFWIAVVRPGWVKIAAEAYGFELLAACDALAAA